MKKSVITIEREYFDNEEGVPCVKRAIKEDDVFIYEDTSTVAENAKIPFDANRFEWWVTARRRHNEGLPDEDDGETYASYPGKEGEVDELAESMEVGPSLEEFRKIMNKSRT